MLRGGGLDYLNFNDFLLNAIVSLDEEGELEVLRRLVDLFSLADFADDRELEDASLDLVSNAEEGRGS